MEHKVYVNNIILEHIYDKQNFIMDNLHYRKPAPNMGAISGKNVHQVVKFVFTCMYINEVRSLTPERNHITIETWERVVIIQGLRKRWAGFETAIT